MLFFENVLLFFYCFLSGYLKSFVTVVQVVYEGKERDLKIKNVPHINYLICVVHFKNFEMKSVEKHTGNADETGKDNGKGFGRDL